MNRTINWIQTGRFPQKKHNLLSELIEINDLYVLSEPNVASVFKDDVRHYLEELNLVFTSDFLSKGTTGLEFIWIDPGFLDSS